MNGTLYVGGCSFSDRFGTSTTCWGEQLAAKLGMTYCHDAVTASGSNDRIWRVLTDKILLGEITQEDKVFIQYTSPLRREFATWKNPLSTDKDIERFHTDTEDLYLLKVKNQSFKWHHDKEISNFLETHDLLVSMEEYAKHIFNQRQYSFQTLLHYHKIDAYILALNEYIKWDADQYATIPEFENRIYKNNELGHAKDERYSDDDPCHLSESGHRIAAERIYTWLNQSK